nr:multivesicular body subunit 12A-like [Cherax quadricarinatus]
MIGTRGRVGYTIVEQTFDTSRFDTFKFVRVVDSCAATFLIRPTVVYGCVTRNSKDACSIMFKPGFSQKAFKKKQLCYKQVPRNMATQTITDIIILSRSKVAPEGFSLVGEMNGLCVCIKPGPAPTPQYNKPPAQASSPLLYGVDPSGRGSSGGGGGGGGGGLYPGLGPAGPAPAPPGAGSGRPQGPAPPLPPRNPPSYASPTHASHNINTLYGPGHSALFGVPFILNKKYVKASDNGSVALPTISKKSRQQIEDEYYYSFTLEQDIVQRPTTT